MFENKKGERGKDKIIKVGNKIRMIHNVENEDQERNTLNLFYFQVRESRAPLNIPTLTLAPDRGGPVACLSGPCLGVKQTARPILQISLPLFPPGAELVNLPALWMLLT